MPYIEHWAIDVNFSHRVPLSFFFQWERATVMANPVMLYRAFLSEFKKILKMWRKKPQPYNNEMTSRYFYYFSGFLSCVSIMMLLTTKLYLENWNIFKFHKQDVPIEFVSEDKSKVDEYLLKKFIIPNSGIDFMNRTGRFKVLDNFIHSQENHNVSTCNIVLRNSDFHVCVKFMQ